MKSNKKQPKFARLSNLKELSEPPLTNRGVEVERLEGLKFPKGVLRQFPKAKNAAAALTAPDQWPVHHIDATNKTDWFTGTTKKLESRQWIQTELERIFGCGFEQQLKGINGYTNLMKNAFGVKIAWSNPGEHNSNTYMIDIPGQPSSLISSTEMFKLLKLLEAERFTSTRFDFAMDIFSPIPGFGMNEMRAKLESRDYFSRHGWQDKTKYSHTNYDCQTLQIGSRESETYGVFYDKAVEQGLDKIAELSGVKIYWIRLEIRFKGSAAKNAFSMLMSIDDVENVEYQASLVGQIISGNLARLVDFVDEKKVALRDCNRCDWWELILDGATKFNISDPIEPPSIEKAKQWIKHQVSTSLAMILCSVDFDKWEKWLYDNVINYGLDRMSEYQASLIKIYKRPIKKQLIQV